MQSPDTVLPCRALFTITLELSEETYVAKGRLFLFGKFMAPPSLHTVKPGRIGPKTSCCMIGSDAGTSVNTVGAVKGNKSNYNSATSITSTPCRQQGDRCSCRNDTDIRFAKSYVNSDKPAVPLRNGRETESLLIAF